MSFKNLKQVKKFLLEAAGSGDSIFSDEDTELINMADEYDVNAYTTAYKAVGMSEDDAAERAKFEADLVNNNSTPEARITKLLYSGKSTSFPDFKEYGEGFQAALSGSIRQNGIYKSSNPFLRYAEMVKDTDVAKATSRHMPAFETIKQLLKSNDLDIDNKNIKQWITDLSSYTADDPAFKIKALTLIASKKASLYGDEKAVPLLIKTIKKSQRKVDIASALDSWQTKDGEDSGGEVPTTAKEKDARDKIVKELESNMQKLVQAIGNDKDGLLQLAMDEYRTGDSIGDVLSKVMVKVNK